MITRHKILGAAVDILKTGAVPSRAYVGSVYWDDLTKEAMDMGVIPGPSHMKFNGFDVYKVWDDPEHFFVV